MIHPILQMRKLRLKEIDLPSITQLENSRVGI